MVARWCSVVIRSYGEYTPSDYDCWGGQDKLGEGKQDGERPVGSGMLQRIARLHSDEVLVKILTQLALAVPLSIRFGLACLRKAKSIASGKVSKS